MSIGRVALQQHHFYDHMTLTADRAVTRPLTTLTYPRILPRQELIDLTTPAGCPTDIPTTRSMSYSLRSRPRRSLIIATIGFLLLTVAIPTDEIAEGVDQLEVTAW